MAKKLTYFDSNFRVYEIYTNANKGFDKARALALNKEGIKFFTVCVFAKSFLGLGAKICFSRVSLLVCNSIILAIILGERKSNITKLKRKVKV